jgi:hypothetical protein
MYFGFVIWYSFVLMSPWGRQSIAETCRKVHACGWFVALCKLCASIGVCGWLWITELTLKTFQCVGLLCNTVSDRRICNEWITGCLSKKCMTGHDMSLPTICKHLNSVRKKLHIMMFPLTPTTVRWLPFISGVWMLPHPTFLTWHPSVLKHNFKQTQWQLLGALSNFH